MVDERAISELIQRLKRCVESHDREEAVRAVLSAVEQGLGIEELYTQVLEPFLASVGRGWQEARTAVWEEHLIVGAMRTAIEALYPRVLEQKAQVETLPLTVAFFCPPEETHDVGLRMLADRFDLRGFRTVYVGAATPVDQMVECVRSTGARVVCLSASTHYQRTALHNVVAHLRESLPGTRIVVGGPAFAYSGHGWQKYTVDSVEALFEELRVQAGVAAPSPTDRGAAAPGATDLGTAPAERPADA